MNVTQKMWKRVLSMTLAIMLLLSSVPSSMVWAETSLARSVELTAKNATLELTGENLTPSTEITIDKVYDDSESPVEVTSENWIRVIWNINDGDEKTSETIIADENDMTKAVATTAKRGVTTVEVTVLYTLDMGVTEKQSKGKIELATWETPVITMNTAETGSAASYPTVVNFTATSSNAKSPKLTIKKGTEDVTALNNTALSVGEYTITAEVAEDTENYYRASTATHTYTVTAGSTEGEIKLSKDSVYWKEEVSFVLPEQKVAGSYHVETTNLTIKNENAPTVSGETVTLIADDTGMGSVKITFTPDDQENYQGFTVQKNIKVEAVPVSAEWEENIFDKDYDGIEKVTTDKQPLLKFADTGSYVLPEDLLIESDEYSFVFDSVDAGNREVTLEKELELRDPRHFKLVNPRPTIKVTIEKKLLELANITISDAIGKVYDGNEKNKTVVAELNNDNGAIVKNELTDKEMSITFDANYYTDGNREYGSPIKEVVANAIVLSSLKVMENGVESGNYYFAQGATKIIEGTFPITPNAKFLEFTGIDSLGNVSLEERNGEEMEIHWFNEITTISKEGFEFSKKPAYLDAPVWDWQNSYTVDSATPTIIYAKNVTNGSVSRPIYVAADTTVPNGQIYAQIDEGEVVPITELVAQYKKLTKGNAVTITFEGDDVESKIATIDFYGSDEKWDKNDAEVWESLTGYTSKDVNTDVKKDERILLDGKENDSIDYVTKETELKKFYYARVTDFAGNISYISSAGVLQDINAPSAEVILKSVSEKYEDRPVYDGTIEFTVKTKDSGITSGIAKVDVTLKNNAGEVVADYTANSENIWTSTEKIAAINELDKEEYPTEAQIIKANEGDLTAQLENLKDGFYTLTVKLTDKVGNVSAEESVSFIKDSKEPVVVVENKLNYNAKSRTEDNLYIGGAWLVTVSDMTLTTEEVDLLTGIDDEIWKTELDEETGLVTKTTTLNFGEGAQYPEGYYAFVVCAEDAASRKTEKSSEKFTIDYTAPTYHVIYNMTAKNAYTGDANKLYYNDKIITTFKIDELTTYDDEILTVTVKNANEEAVIQWPEKKVLNENYVLEHEKGTNTFKLTIKGVAENDDDGYTFEISGKDKAGNILIPKNETDKAELNIVRAMDVTKPVLETVSYSTFDAFVTVQGKDYVNQETEMEFKITEHNPTANISEITSDGEAKESKWESEVVDGSEKLDSYITKLEVPMFGEKGDEQIISMDIVDKAGNFAVLGKNMELRSEKNTSFKEAEGKFVDKFTVDTVAPEIKLEYSGVVPSRIVDGIDYFGKKDNPNLKVQLKVTVNEHNFYEERFLQLVAKTDTSVKYDETEWIGVDDSDDICTKIFTFTSDNQYDLSIIGTDNANNKFVWIEEPDKNEISCKFEESENDKAVKLTLAIDSTLPTIGDKTKPVITIKNPSPSQGTTTDGQNLYNTDVTYEVVVYDPLLNKYASGIDNIIFHAKGEDGTVASLTVDKKGNVVGTEDETGNLINGSGLTVTKKSVKAENLAKGVEERYIFEVTIGKGTFNTNGIVLSVEAEDVSTNVQSMSANPIAIDTTQPKVTVSYDNNDVSNGKYFHAARTATVKIVERNFSNDCFQFYVNGSDKKLEFKLSSAGSGNRDDAVWVASYSFGSDADYKVDAEVKDRATNKGSVSYTGEAPQDFTVDMTKPIVEIEFDNHNVFNENYYDAQRVATVIITERNFDGSDVEIIGEATDAGAQVTYPSISAWSDDGDVHRATITYAEDALYTLDVEYADLATNEADDIDEERFTVDTTDPEVSITDVENETPYPDEVRPRIDFSDNNYDRYDLDFTYTAREQRGIDVEEEIAGVIGVAVDATGKGVGGKLLNDVEHVEEKDGIYTLTITVFDKAGRSKQETVTYSVNRFGTVYVYSEDLSDMMKGYYQTSKVLEKELYISAFNADQLIEDSTKLEISCDGSTLATQNSHADVAEALQPSAGGWFEYQFDLVHSDFASDGRYTVTISDQDEAGNTRTNSDNPIEFYVDNTAPELDSVIGMEEKSVNDNSKLIEYIVSDAIALKSVKIYVNDELKETIEEFDSSTEYSGKFTLGTGSRQKVRFEIEDQAENKMNTASEDFEPAYVFQPEITVSTNFFVRWYANTAVFWSSIAAMALAAGGGIVFLVMKKRKEQVEVE